MNEEVCASTDCIVPPTRQVGTLGGFHLRFCENHFRIFLEQETEISKLGRKLLDIARATPPQLYVDPKLDPEKTPEKQLEHWRQVQREELLMAISSVIGQDSVDRAISSSDS